MTLAGPLKKMLIGGAFSTEKSRIRLFGRMDWTLEPSAGMAQLIQLPAEEVQKKFNENGRDFLFKFGYENGKVIFDEVCHCLAINDEKKLENIINDILEFIGIGQPKFVISNIKKNGKHHIVIHMLNNPIIENAKKMYGKKSMVCSFFMGLFSVYVERLLKVRKVRLKEKKCICKNNDINYCEWESRC